MLTVNLLPKEELEKKALGKFLKWVLSYGRYIIITVELIVFVVFFSRFIYDRQLADLNDEIEQKQAIVAAAAEFEERVRTTHHRISQVKSLETDRSLYLDTLLVLEEITPKEVVFKDLKLSGTQFVLDGEANTNESFAKFVLALKNHPAFSEVTLNRLGKVEGEDERLAFQTTVQLTISKELEVSDASN